MGNNEIKEMGRLLKLHALIDELTERVKAQLTRKSNLKDSVYRAFRDTDTNTDLLTFIREEGSKLLMEKKLLPAMQEAA